MLKFIATGILIVFVLLGILAYIIIPDNTPNANTQILEYNLLGSNSRVWVAKVPIEQAQSGSWWSGYPKPYQLIAVDSVKNHRILYRVNGKIDTVASAELLQKQYILGTDKYGRDVLSRLIAGARTSLMIGFFSVLITTVLGVVIGMYAGYYRGRIDALLMWFINVFWTMPTLLVIVALTVSLGKGFWQIFVALGCTLWVSLARAVRGQVLLLREMEYIQAAKALSFSDMRVMWVHIFPNLLGLIVIYATESFANAILLESGLSFLGLGIQPPTPSWGSMFKDGFYFITNAEYRGLVLYPGFAIMFTVLAFNLLGNLLQDYIQKRRK